VSDETAKRPIGKKKAKARDRDSRIQRGVMIRAGLYIFGTHIVAAWVMLLFYLGQHK
jgi:serine acetyltransferase